MVSPTKRFVVTLDEQVSVIEAVNFRKANKLRKLGIHVMSAGKTGLDPCFFEPYSRHLLTRWDGWSALLSLNMTRTE